MAQAQQGKTSDKEAAALPDPAELAQTYAEVAERSARLLSDHVGRQLSRGMTAPSDELGLARAFMDMTSKLFADPLRLAQVQMSLVWDYFSLWQNSMQRFMGFHPDPVATPARDDKRFKDEDWQDCFLFDYIKQSYLITARHIHDSVANIDGLDEITRKKVNFFTRSYVDALSPSNFVLTNPQVFRETVRSHGQNLVKGFNNLLRDIEEGDGQLKIRMTDTSAFALGKNVATTPGKVVFENALFQLLQYTPTTDKVFARPLLIVPPWINKYYVLDLREKNSLIKWLVDQGHTVFVMSWVNPDARLADKGFDDYVQEGLLSAVDKVLEQTGASSLNAAGYCLGGTLLGTTMAYLAAKRDKRIASASYFTSLLDFSAPGELGVFIDEEQVRNLEKKMEERGYLEGSEMANTFNMMRSNDLIWSFVINNYLLGKDPFPFDLLYWNSDSTRMPAKMHSFYLRNMYMKNALREPGGIEVLGTKIDLAKVKAPSYFISTIEDHIAPWKTTYLGAQLFSGPVRFVLGGSGHIAGVVNPPVANKYAYWSAPELAATAEDWYASAEQHAGSWWPDWQAWLLAQDDKQVAPRDPAQGKLEVLEDAPGSYVKMRLDKSVR
ncbi:class I poly(R)-hydroxyalkanoic acid synthase [Uliginosibacterium sediminicola]|uniref:Class I poly(R)-hydroxyalkanoic acid synthase n=1 Tax=Uliginosibacterium sediminicola TaxID=2024550 RepID=A0ABU9YTV3_9RHOO